MSGKTTTGLVRIDTPEQLFALADAAARTYDGALLCLRDVMTPTHCQEVRDLRIDSDGEVYGSWRYVAGECHKRWQASWEPHTNQLWGMALCQIAAEFFGENSREAPWN